MAGRGIKFEGASQLFIGQAPKQECVLKLLFMPLYVF